MDYNKIIPEQYWKNVIKKNQNPLPVVLMVDEDVNVSATILGFMKALVGQACFDVLPMDKLALVSPLVGVKYLVNVPTRNEWGRYDYALCSSDNYEIMLPALLSGVRCFTTLADLREYITKIPTSIDRVEAWEDGKNLLDKLKKT